MRPAAAGSGAVERHVHLGRAWARRGRPELALAEYKAVLRLDPEFVPALRNVAETLLDLGRASEALEHYALAHALAPDNGPLDLRYRHLQSQLKDGVGEERLRDAPWPAGPARRQDLSRRSKEVHVPPQRLGLRAYALAPLHHSDGIHFDGFIENNFAWLHRAEGIRPPVVLERMRQEGTFYALATSEEKGITPYTHPWVGVVHNPPNMPEWYHPLDWPQTIFAKDIWKRSVEHCQGLFALSEYAAHWLREETRLPVSTLVAPTEIPAVQFDFARFEANRSRKVVQVGWWLRNLIGHLPAADPARQSARLREDSPGPARFRAGR